MLFPVLSDPKDTEEVRKALLDLQSQLSQVSTASASSQAPFREVLVVISNNAADPTNDIDFAPGQLYANDNASRIALTSSLTKRLDANWTAGTGNGGLDTGAKANSTWYYCYVIKNPSLDAVDAIFSTSSTSPTLPTGYTLYRRIGAVRTDASGNILGFTQFQKYFEYKVTQPITIINLSSTTRQVLTAPAPANSIANIITTLETPNGYALAWLKSTSFTDVAVSNNNANANAGDQGIDLPQTCRNRVPLDSNSQFALRLNQALSVGIIFVEGFEIPDL